MQLSLFRNTSVASRIDRTTAPALLTANLLPLLHPLSAHPLTLLHQLTANILPLLHPLSAHALPLLHPLTAHALPLLHSLSAHALPYLHPLTAHPLTLLHPLTAHALPPPATAYSSSTSTPASAYILTLSFWGSGLQAQVFSLMAKF